MALQAQCHAYGPAVVEGNAQAQFGDQYINVNHFHQQPQGSTSERPQPSIILPFNRNRDFIARDEFLTLWYRRNQLGYRTAIVGLGGAGKSHLAIEFAYRIHDEKPNLWVFWVHASSTARFQESYKIIAESMQIPGRHEAKADILVLVRTWLSQREHGSWVLVVDNADDEHLVLGTQSATPKDNESTTISPLFHYLPCVGHGRILLTTRNRAVAYALAEESEDIVHLGPMDSTHAVQLLEKKLRRSGATYTSHDLMILAQQLDYIPLALTQAAAYIRQRAPRMTVTKYTYTLQQGDEQRGRLLQTAVPDMWRDFEASNSIIKTFHQSFSYLQQQHKSASQLLSFMSTFDREGIPENLLIGKYHLQYENTNNARALFEGDIAILRNFGLINQSSTMLAFDMHRIVQFATRQWLEITQELASWQQRCIDILHEHLPTAAGRDWPCHELLFPHVASMRIIDSSGLHLKESYASLLLRAARFADIRGWYDQAGAMTRESYDLRVLLAGPNCLASLESMGFLGRILENQGRYEEAEEILQRALSGLVKYVGQDHYATLEVMHNFAAILWRQNKLQAAEEMLRKELQGLERCPGVTQFNIRMNESVLGVVLADQGKFIEAEAMFRRHLLGIEYWQGEDHFEVLADMHNLGEVLQRQGKFREAETIHRRCLATSETMLGKYHPETIRSVWALARVLEATYSWAEALECYTRAMSGFERQLGYQHPDSITCRNGRAQLQAKMATLNS